MWIPFLYRFWRLAFRDSFSPSEMFRLDLLDPTKSEEYLGARISKEKLLSLQDKLNPVALTDRTEQKDSFGSWCAQHQLPAPVSVACFYDGIDENGQSPQQRISQIPDGHYILKPAQGCYGVGVQMFAKRGETYANQRGQQCQIATVCDDVISNFGGFRSWVIQPRFLNHPDVMAISPSQALQTCRVVTFVCDDGRVHVIASQWRLAGPNSIKDNFDKGATQNILSTLDERSGVIRSALTFDPDGVGVKYLAEHPVSGISFSGTRVPFWDDIVTLAKRAALAFLPVRSIGWDIGVGQNGLVLIEGNRSWDPQNIDGKMADRIAFMRANCSALRT